MPGEHPFQQLFETFGRLPAAHSDSVNRQAREVIRKCLSGSSEKSGHCILLKAPRAGHGKTHLLTRLQHELGGTHEFIPLQAVGGSRIDPITVLEDALRRLIRALPAAGGLTVLDLVARRLFSAALQPLVNSGEVPCQDREGALTALRARPIESFDFHHPGAVTAHWALENFELLGPRLSLELCQKNGLALREVSFWVDAMFRFASTPVDNPTRVRTLAANVFGDPSAETTAYERLVALLGLMGSLMRVVLVADELEGFSADETAALRFASFLGSLRQSVDRLDVILSVNQDIWESAFLPRLSAGLADRLSEITVELQPLSHEGMIAIIESRSPGMGEQILASYGEKDLPTYARGIIKVAAESWGLEPKSVGEDDLTSAAAFVPPLAQPETSAPAFPETALDSLAPSPAPVAEMSAKLPDPVDAPTKFSPEAAIAAFKSATQTAESRDSEFMEAAAPADFQPWGSPVVQDYVPPQFVNPPASPPETAAFDSPFRIDTEAESALQAFQGNFDPLAPHDPAVDTASTDRVDDLLRQFRERYGKS